MNVDIEDSWKALLQPEFDSEYFAEIVSKIKTEYATHTVFPLPQYIFRACNEVPVNSVKVCILGQDPYHTPGVADGLSFSSPQGNKVPPSLQNMYKEIISEFGIADYPHMHNPDLTRWAQQGVLLLNSSLTVRSRQANSHKSIGWSQFTDALIQRLSDHTSDVVFMLWGSYACGKKPLIDSAKHLVLESPHPSPFSAHKGFFGNNHFIQCNNYLENVGKKAIEW